MKRNLTLSLVLLALVAATGWIASPSRFSLQPESRLWVEGTSSIHDWTCESEAFAGILDASTPAGDEILGVEVTVPIGQLECKNGTMNKKMRDALEAKQFPQISYVLTEAEAAAPAPNGTYTLRAKGRLTIAGQTRPIAMTVTGKKEADGRIRFQGSAPVTMSDFGVDAPTAMLGTLKTGDEVTVKFDVVAGR